jgi:hypothetical protein
MLLEDLPTIPGAALVADWDGRIWEVTWELLILALFNSAGNALGQNLVQRLLKAEPRRSIHKSVVSLQLTEAVEQGPQARPVALRLHFFLSADLFGALSGVTKKTYKSSDLGQHSLPWHHY